MGQSVPFTISYGDEITNMEAVLDIMRECGAVLEVEMIQSGEDLYRHGIKEGLLPEFFDPLKRTKLLLKGMTKKPKGDFIEVTEAICEKLGLKTLLEYYVCENTPGIGIVTETETKITPEMIEDVYKASKQLSGRNFAYTIDELRLMFDKTGENYPLCSAKYLSSDELKEKYGEYDVIVTDKKASAELRKAIKPKCGCNIYLGNGYAVFEPIEDYNNEGRGLLLAAAMILKYAGQNPEAWSVYEKLTQ
jgi:hypothetical protein